jgi:hypothetical protein
VSRRFLHPILVHIMRIHRFILPLLASIATASAQPQSRDSARRDPVQSPREIALDNMLSERDSIKALESAITEARRNGVSDQAILEARFLYHVDHGDDVQIAAMLPEFMKRRDSFKLEDSAIFNVKEDWLAVIEYVQAIDAIAKGDKDAFKKHITEAFWLSPNQAAAFAPHIERLRLEESMRSLKVDLSLKPAPLLAGDAVELGKLADGRKALLFHFWSPMSRECEASLPDFAATATMLEANGITVASLVPEGAAKLLDDARAMVHTLGDKPPGAWLVDPKDKSLAREFRVQNLPVMVLVSTDGKVLYNGDPTDDAFWDTLKKIDAKISRPQSTLRKNDEKSGE